MDSSGPVRCRFNGASLFRAKETPTKTWIASSANRFNGASLFRARKHVVPITALIAAMMLQWGLTLPSKETSWPHRYRLICKLLQWGLTLPSKETLLPELDPTGPLAASMGPHSSEQGNAMDIRVRLVSRRIASMGPHSSEQGNVGVTSDIERRKRASMGPHSSEQGNAFPNRTENTAEPLQWGLTLPSKETTS